MFLDVDQLMSETKLKHLCRLKAESAEKKR